ncbi:DUF6263 family protein [Sphingobacterium sp. LRF_L2]|uniref:DUF6263 family protein n=1 Tax=Sphingobacterium sp. LRF_L2 TaxID=3369421 RepID=UPI003F61CC2F
MRKLFITGAILFTGLFSFAQKTINFQLNPEIGKPLIINMLVKTDVDGPQSIIMDMAMKMTMTPTQRVDEKITIENVTNSIKTDINAGMMTMSYNSEQEPQDEAGKMLAAQFSKIVGQTITMVLTSKGEALDIILPEGMQETVDKSTFSNITTPLPAESISIGASWKHEAEMSNNPIIAKTESTSTFKEETSDGYVIEVVGKLLDESNNEIGTISGLNTLDKKTFITKKAQVKTIFESEGTKIVSDIDMNVE